MFSGLPSLFGRNFAVGFFLPAAVFAGVTLALADRYGLASAREMWRFAKDYEILSAVLAPFLLWLVAISLHAANTWILRRKEGYMPRSWMYRLRPGWWWQRRRLRRLAAKLREPGCSPRRSRRLRERLAAGFPHPPRDRLLLPSSFGNTVRAFEAYPGKMYGFEATRGWSRLLAVIPDEYRELIDNAKTEVDFLVNLWFLSWLVMAEYIALAWGHLLADWWIPLLAYLSARLASLWSRSAAVRWGEMVKGAFDVFLPALRDKLELPPATSREQERKMWRRFSRAILLRDPDELPPPRVAEDGDRDTESAEGSLTPPAAPWRRGSHPV